MGTGTHGTGAGGTVQICTHSLVQLKNVVRGRDGEQQLSSIQNKVRYKHCQGQDCKRKYHGHRASLGSAARIATCTTHGFEAGW